MFDYKKYKQTMLVVAVALCFAACDESSSNTNNNTNSSDTPTVTTCEESQNTCLSSKEVLHCVDGKRIREYCSENELCYNGQCGQVMCKPYAIDHCLENGQYYGCNPLGTGMDNFDCGNDLTCVDAKCVARVCKKNSGKCVDDDTILLCNEAGTAYDVKKKCQDIAPKSTCSDNACIPICDKVSKDASYIGCDYWAVDLDNALDAGVYDAAGMPFAVVLSNTNETLAAHVQILTRKNNSVSVINDFEIAPKSLEKVYLPKNCYYANYSCPEASTVQGTGITQASYHIKSDLPITAAQFNPLNNYDVFSNDASLLFPETAVGKRYMVMSRQQNYESFSSFVTIVAAEPGQTEVKFKSSCSILAGYDKNGGIIPAMKKGQTQTFILDQYDVLNLETSAFGEDPTGSLINADKNVIVFAGAEATSIPERKALCTKESGKEDVSIDQCCITCCADHIEHQQYPLSAWGRDYNAVKLKPRGAERDMWRILARTDDTHITTTPNVFPEGTPGLNGNTLVLNAGKWIDILTSQSFNIHSSSPVLVGQFMTGQDDPMDLSTCQMDVSWMGSNAAGIGDPAYIIGVPVEQYRKNYTFLAPTAYAKDYITIVAPVGTTVTLDGSVLDPAEFKSFGNDEYVYAYRLIEDGRHDLEASKPVGLFVYGVDNYVSYGYPAGLDLKSLFED